MKESEAKTKWCPFVRITQETEHVKSCTNRGDVALTTKRHESLRSDPETNCIGSSCAAWLWDDDDPEVDVTHGTCGLVRP